MEIQRIRIKDLAQNKGQIPGLPTNPRQWTREEIDKIARSLKETPELFEARPIIVTPWEGKFIILGGNLRFAGCKANKDKDAPCIVIPEGTPVDKMKEIVIKDNGSFGAWDYDALANLWDDLPLVAWGVPAWEQRNAEKALSTEGRKGGEGYDEFTGKFNEDLPLTTDDCYTPPEVFELVRKFVDEKVIPLGDKKVVRPFFPGGNYEDLAQYPEGCVVLDNPPFSLYAKIVRFYLEHGIKFFLFGPQLSLLVYGADCCFCPFNVPITYENGAKVSTGFVTNLRPGVRVWVESSLRVAIQKAQKTEPTIPMYEYPAEVINSALLGKIAHYGDLTILSSEARFIKNLDGMKEIGADLFGGGFLISTQAAARVQEAADKAKAETKKARTTKIALSDSERALVAELSAQNEIAPQGEK